MEKEQQLEGLHPDVIRQREKEAIIKEYQNYLIPRIKDISDGREHKTNEHYLGFEEAIDEVLKMFN